MKKLSTLKIFFLFCCFIIGVQNAFSQTTIFSENIGTPSGTTTIAVYSAGTAPATFQNRPALTFSNGGAANPADVRATSFSTGYTAASGGGNVFFSSTSGEYGFSIESINVPNYNSLLLQFGYRKESASAFANFSVEFWNGTVWIVIANSPVDLFNEVVSSSTGWYLSKLLTLPAAAQISSLKIRFVKTGTSSIRVDDIKLTGQIATPTTTSISPASATAGDPAFTLTVNGTGFASGNSTVTWNGLNRTTTFVSATQLTAAIPSTDLSAAAIIPVGVTTTGAAAASNTQNFTVNAASGGTFTVTSSLPAFGNVCINTTAVNSFTLDGNNLNGSAITISGPGGYSYSEISGGPFTTTLNFTYTGSSFSGKIIYVQFLPTAVQSYTGNISLNGGGVTNYPVSATGTGINDAPTVVTSGSSNVTATTATISATISNIGCAAITAYGFEYSTTSGFPNGTGTQVLSSNLSGGIFSAVLSGLAPNTRYYYKAFATNSIGTTYGVQFAFTCTPLAVVMSAQPGLSYTETFADIANWSNFFITGVGANRFSGLNSTGSGGIPNGTTITSPTLSFQAPFGTPPGPSSGAGVHKGTDQVPSTQSIVLLSTGSGDNTTSAAIDFYMDFTGLNANTLSFDYAVINNSTGDRNGSLRVYGTTDGITFTELANAAVLNFTNNVVFSGSKTNVQLPASFNTNPNARLRFYYHNGTGGTTGSRPKISIDNLNVTAVATTPCSTPTAPATGLTFGTITDISIQGSFTAANPATDSYIIIMSSNSSLISNPVNGQTYSIGDNVGDGSVISKGIATSFTATGLTALTTYYFFVFPMNAICTGGPLYYTSNILTGNAATIAGLPPCAAPANQPSNLIFGTPATNSISGSFTATTANEYLVIRSTSSSLSNNPVNAQVYNSGDVIGNGIVVQRSAATTFTANGLMPNTPYFFFVFSLNSQACINGPAYNVTNPLTASQSTIPLPPCTTPTAQGTALSLATSNTSVSGTFTGVSNADNYLIIKSTSATLGAIPTDNTDYNAGGVFGNGTVVSNTTSTTFYATVLTPNTTYYFFIFAANKTCSGGTKYATQPALSGNITTTNGGANNYYFGTLHSHSDYSDGNADNPGFTPAQNYAYAKNSLCMDYLGISEHNHFSAGTQISNYYLGSAQANNFTAANPNFLALYGMEWGVISGGGHLLIYGDGMDDLWGWESGSGAWGPTNNYDVFVPKSVYTGSTGLFKTVNDNILKKTFATLAHPGLFDFNNIANIAYDAVADGAIVGVAVESGPAFSTNTTYTNPGSSLSFLYYYQLLLAKGYSLGPSIDHDNHNTTFGRTTTSRTAVIAPSLTKTSFVNAMRNMNFYATQDCDTKVDFTINTKTMGSSLSDRFGPNIFVSLSDATTSVSGAIIRVMYGAPGSGVTAVKIDSAISSTLSFTDNTLANMATGYYYLDITNGTGRIITSPIWYTRNDALTALPVKLNSFTVQKANSSARLDWSTDQELNSNYFSIERSGDGRKWNSILRVNAAGNSTTVKNYRAFDNAPLNGINYYRLKQFDLDGKFEYSAVKSISFNKEFSISVTPNPAKDFFTVSVDKKDNKIISIEISDITGKVIRKLSSLQSLVSISTTGMAKGMYFVKVSDESNQSTQRVIIQ